MAKYNVYSLADTKVIVNHPDVGQCVISEAGGGRVVIAYSGDMSTHTVSATGYPVINKLRNLAGSVTLELPHNSDTDLWMRKWCAYIDASPSSTYALTTVNITDYANGRQYNCVGVTPQKRPDVNYDQSSTFRNYVLLCAEITES